MTPRPLLLTVACVALLAAGGCSTLSGGSCHKQQDYETAGNLPPLRMPSGLEGPDTSGALDVPDIAAPELPPDPEGPCLDAPPALTEPPPPPSEVVLPDPTRGDAEGGSQAEAAGDRPERSRRRPPRRPR